MSKTELETDRRDEEHEKGDDDQDEPDEWDQRITDTGCSAENEALTDCYYETKDWRQCTKEMEAFKECWSREMNNDRTRTKDA